MSENYKTGVVNKNLQLFNYKNVFICSTSSFPTGGCEHPTFTLIALSIRLAQFLRKSFNT